MRLDVSCNVVDIHRKPPPPVLGLPVDTKKLIVTFLPWKDRGSLFMTCKHLYGVRVLPYPYFVDRGFCPQLAAMDAVCRAVRQEYGQNVEARFSEQERDSGVDILAKRCEWIRWKRSHVFSTLDSAINICNRVLREESDAGFDQQLFREVRRFQLGNTSAMEEIFNLALNEDLHLAKRIAYSAEGIVEEYLRDLCIKYLELNDLMNAEEACYRFSSLHDSSHYHRSHYLGSVVEKYIQRGDIANAERIANASGHGLSDLYRYYLTNQQLSEAERVIQKMNPPDFFRQCELAKAYIAASDLGSAERIVGTMVVEERDLSQYFSILQGIFMAYEGRQDLSGAERIVAKMIQYQDRAKRIEQQQILDTAQRLRWMQMQLPSE